MSSRFPDPPRGLSPTRGSRPDVHPLGAELCANWASQRATSAGAIRIVRSRANELGLDASHFGASGDGRTLNSADAVVAARSLGTRCCPALRLSTYGSGAPTHVKAMPSLAWASTSAIWAARGRPPTRRLGSPPPLVHLARCRLRPSPLPGLRFAVAMCCSRSSPPFTTSWCRCRRDCGGSRSRRRHRWVRAGGRSALAATLSRLKRAGIESPYDPDVIDYFFIVDGDLAMYLIPSQIVAGRVALGLRTYKQYIVGSAAGFLDATAARAAAVVSQSA